MKTLILSIAYRRYHHSVRRSSLAERTLPKMKDIEYPIKAGTGEFAAHRLPKTLLGNNKGILAHTHNLSNDSGVTVQGLPPCFHCYTSLQVRFMPCLRKTGKGVNLP